MSTESKDSSEIGIFHLLYKLCCKRENMIPSKKVILKNNGYSLDFCVDRIRYVDWAPILIALSQDTSLQSIVIRCKCPKKTILEQVESERIARNVIKCPVILTKFMLSNLVEATAQCLSQTSVLTVLQIQGLPLPIPYISILAEALATNNSLQHLSLSGCLIGDDGCQRVCLALRHTNNIITVDFTACNLSHRAAPYIADMIKFFKIYRYSENWKQTLRYQNPDLDSMPGLRHLTLSDNPEFCDTGFMVISDILMDDLWIKVLCLRRCGLTENIIKNCLQLLELNTCLCILDLCFNSQISLRSVGTINALLKKNENKATFDPKWLIPTLSSSIVSESKVSLKTLKNKSTPFKRYNLFKDKIENKSSNENIQVQILQEQLKREVAYRQQLEELNEKLLNQLKELKCQQINQWRMRASLVDSDSSKKSESIKTKQIYTINLNDDSHWQMKPTKLCANHSYEKIGDNNTNKPLATSSSFVNLNHMHNISQFNDFENTEEMKRKMFTGADILEKLIEQRIKNKLKHCSGDAQNIDGDLALKVLK